VGISCDVSFIVVKLLKPVESINQYIFNQGKPLGVSLLKYVKYAFFSLVQNIGNLFRGFITHIDYFIGSLDKPS